MCISFWKKNIFVQIIIISIYPRFKRDDRIKFLKKLIGIRIKFRVILGLFVIQHFTIAYGRKLRSVWPVMLDYIVKVTYAVSYLRKLSWLMGGTHKGKSAALSPRKLQSWQIFPELIVLLVNNYIYLDRRFYANLIFWCMSKKIGNGFNISKEDSKSAYCETYDLLFFF